MEDLVGKGQKGSETIQVPRGGWKVDRLHRVSTVEVDDVEVLTESDQVGVVLEVACASPPIGVRGIGGRGDRAEVDAVGTHDEVVVGIASMKRERRRHARHFLQHPFGIEADPLGPGFNSSTTRRQDRQRLGMEEVHADLGQNSERGVVDRLDLVAGQHFQWAERISDASPGELMDSDSSPTRPALGPG